MNKYIVVDGVAFSSSAPISIFEHEDEDSFFQDYFELTPEELFDLKKDGAGGYDWLETYLEDGNNRAITAILEISPSMDIKVLLGDLIQ